MKIIGIVPAYNDEGIIEEAIEHLISQGIELVVLDNGSTDKTFQICEKFLDKGLLQLEQFKSDSFHEELILHKLYDMAISESPDWVLRSDSDHFLESGIKDLTLKDVIYQADLEGYNIIQFDRFDFFMTDNDNESARSIKEKLPYYSFASDYAYRAWKYVTGINPVGLAGHCPFFPPNMVYKFYPRNLVIRHYNARSKQQIENKIQDRIKRLASTSLPHPSPQRRVTNYLKRRTESNYSSPVDHRILTKYNEDNQWNRERKYSPFVEKRPTRMELFSSDGLMNPEYSQGKEKKLSELLAKKQAHYDEVIERLNSKIKKLEEKLAKNKQN